VRTFAQLLLSRPLLAFEDGALLLEILQARGRNAWCVLQCTITWRSTWWQP